MSYLEMRMLDNNKKEKRKTILQKVLTNERLRLI